MGFTPILTPMLTIQSVPAEFESAEGLQAVIVASGNALVSLPSAFLGLPVLAVGDATAQRARAAGFAKVHSAAGDAAALAVLTVRTLRPDAGALLLLCGQGQGDALATALRAQGFSVRRRVTYAAVPARDLPDPAIAALRAKTVARALFFSTETARTFVRVARRTGIAGMLGAVEAIAIGQPAAMALEALPWRRIRIARRPTQDEMLAMLT